MSGRLFGRQSVLAGGAQPATFWEDFVTSASAPSTAELPALEGKPEGYIATVYDIDGNASVNNGTVTAHADDGGATLATLSVDSGRVWFRVVSGAWEQQGVWP